jgi:hypothetical protein
MKRALSAPRGVQRGIEGRAGTHGGVGLVRVGDIVAADIDRLALDRIQLGNDLLLVLGESSRQLGCSTTHADPTDDVVCGNSCDGHERCSTTDADCATFDPADDVVCGDSCDGHEDSYHGCVYHIRVEPEAAAVCKSEALAVRLFGAAACRS